MKSIAEKLTEIVSGQPNKIEAGEITEIKQLLADLKQAGLIKTPHYNLPLVDTIGRTYYSSVSKRK